MNVSITERDEAAMFKKILSDVLVLCLSVGMLPQAIASEAPDISPEVLRVSEDFAAKYPNGLVELATVNFDTVEGAEDFTVYVVRRGGTSGKITVDLKVIETTAKYGDDFTMLLSDGTEVKKDSDSPTMLESAVAGGEYSVVTTGSAQDRKDVQAQEEIQAEDRADESAPAEERARANAQSGESARPGETAQAPGYTSSLHKLRDEALGVTSEVPSAAPSAADVYDVSNSQQTEAGAALNAVMPGAATTLTFSEGENVKTVKIHICDDDIVESAEQFNIGLCNITGGAVLGDAISAGCNIADNDVGAGAVVAFEQASYTAPPSDRQVELKLLRTGDAQTYATILFI